jgi:hypothetical protein
MSTHAAKKGSDSGQKQTAGAPARARPVAGGLGAATPGLPMSRAQLVAALPYLSYEQQVELVRPKASPLTDRPDFREVSGGSGEAPVQMSSEQRREPGEADWLLEPDRLLLWGFGQGDSTVHLNHYDGLGELRVFLGSQAEVRGGRRADWWRYIDRIIGYASPEGEGLDNLELGFARARSVAEVMFTPEERDAMERRGQPVGDLVFSRGEGHPGQLAQRDRWPRYRAVVIELTEPETLRAPAPDSGDGRGEATSAELPADVTSEAAALMSRDVVGDVFEAWSTGSTVGDVLVGLGTFGETIASLNFINALVATTVTSLVEWASALRLPYRAGFTFGAPYGFVYSARGLGLPAFPYSDQATQTQEGWQQGTQRGFDAFSARLRNYCEQTITEARGRGRRTRYGYAIRDGCRRYYSDEAEATYRAFLAWMDIDENAHQVLNRIFQRMLPEIRYTNMERTISAYELILQPPGWRPA